MLHLRPRTDADCETVADWIDDAEALYPFTGAEARKLGATTLTLNVIAGNRPAIRTYERAGFRSVEPTTDVEAYAMTRSLRR